MRRRTRNDLLNMIIETELLVDEFLSQLAGVRDCDECRVILQDGQTQLRYSHHTEYMSIEKARLTGNNEAKAREWTTARAKKPSVLFLYARHGRGVDRVRL